MTSSTVTSLSFLTLFNKFWTNPSGAEAPDDIPIVSELLRAVIGISFSNNSGICSARAIENVDLGKIILNAKSEKLLISGGGHSMAAGLKINFSNMENFKIYLEKSLSHIQKVYLIELIILTQ